MVNANQSTQERYLEESEFRAGYNAYYAYVDAKMDPISKLAYRRGQSQEWQDGYDTAAAVETRSETMRYT